MKGAKDGQAADRRAASGERDNRARETYMGPSSKIHCARANVCFAALDAIVEHCGTT